jgi:hypothetical protein
MWNSKDVRGRPHSENRLNRKQKSQQRAKSYENKTKISKGYQQNQKAKMFKESPGENNLANHTGNQIERATS